MSKYYTSRGDQGQTDHIGKGRISKAHIRIQTVGSLDEASAALGFARAHLADPEVDQLIKTTQKDLYQIMSIVALEKPDHQKIPDLRRYRICVGWPTRPPFAFHEKSSGSSSKL